MLYCVYVFELSDPQFRETITVRDSELTPQKLETWTSVIYVS